MYNFLYDLYTVYLKCHILDSYILIYIYIFEQKAISMIFGGESSMFFNKKNFNGLCSLSTLMSSGEAVAFIWRGDLNFDDRSLDI